MIDTVTASRVIREVEGGTMDLQGRLVNRESGFAVGIHECDSIENALFQALRGQFVGWWRDNDTGRVYVDIVSIVEDREVAEDLGRRYGQIAIWDFKNQSEIRL